MKLSVVVLTKNDEKLIDSCLESVKWAEEIIVYDNDSVDKTKEIARKYTDKVFNYYGNDFSEHRNLGMEKSVGEWVFYVDSDERVLRNLRDEILNLIGNTGKSAFAVRRKNIIFGQEVNYGPYRDDRMVRLLKRDRFKKWVGSIHERALFEGDLGYTKNFLLHLTHRNLDQIVLKSLSWSNIDASLRLKTNHPSMSGWRFLRIFVTETWNQLIIRKGLFGGSVGLMDSLLQVFSLYMSYVRLWEKQQPVSLDKKYADIDKKLIESEFNY